MLLSVPGRCSAHCSNTDTRVLEYLIVKCGIVMRSLASYKTELELDAPECAADSKRQLSFGRSAETSPSRELALLIRPVFNLICEQSRTPVGRHMKETHERDHARRFINGVDRDVTPDRRTAVLGALHAPAQERKGFQRVELREVRAVEPGGTRASDFAEPPAESGV